MLVLFFVNINLIKENILFQILCFSFYFLHVILDLQSIINDDEQSNLTNNSKDWRTTWARETKKEEQDKEDDEN